jgi:hypothetical protein
MTVKKLQFAPGFNQEITRYASEGRWWSGDKVRFRMGFPEKIGGYARISPNTFLGVCRSIYPWSTLGGLAYAGVGTHLKYYVELVGGYSDITPLRATAALTDPFSVTTGSDILTVVDAAHGASTGDFVTFSGATGLGGTVTSLILNAEFQVLTVIDDGTFTVRLPVVANASDTGAGGAVSAAYQIPVGAEIQVPVSGWGAGGWGLGAWGTGEVSFAPVRIWSQSNFGEDLVFAPRGESRPTTS